MTEKRFKVAVYDDKAINRFAVLDLQKPNSSKRLKYENVYIGSKEGCEIVCNFGNSLADENEQLKSILKIYHKVANCRNCHYHDYDTLFGGYDDYEICNKGNDVSDGICSEWREH